MPYGQSGRRALVYQLRDQDGRQFALKVFRQTFRSVEIEQSAKNLQNYASLLGLGVCQRWVLTDTHDATLLQQYPDLHYAILMTWVQGLTWQEVILTRTDFNPRQSYQFANGLVNILAGMERSGVAHCDLSGANVLLPGLADQHPLVALVDVEEMYIPGTQGPTTRPAGSLGYNHPSTASGLWSADVDRFAGAVLIAEMLGWFDLEVRQAALTGTDGSPGEQYFAADEIQQPCRRFDMLYHSLETRWSTNMAALLARAWSSATLSACPWFAEWQDGFPTLMTRLAQFEEMSLPRKDAGYQVRWSKLPSVADSDLLVGGRYRILQLFSDGGFGLVYLAIDTRGNSQCVLKKNKDTSEESRRQFAREADLLRRLDHRNLVKVLDYLDLPNDGQYIVMESVQGDDLQTIMTRHGPTHFNWALSCIEQICDALSYLHTQNPPIIHRDIKPANIRITSDKRVVLIDFGIAKTTGETSAATLGARAVSPGFSPPEQYGQNSTNIRSDVYALGATVWALLAGQIPQVSVDRIKHDSMFPLSGVLPLHIEATLQRALDLNPMRRFASVHEFWLALSVAPQRQPTTLHIPPQPGRKPNRKKNTPWLFVIVGCLVFAFFAIGYSLAPLLPTPGVRLTPQKTENLSLVPPVMSTGTENFPTATIISTLTFPLPFTNEPTVTETLSATISVTVEISTHTPTVTPTFAPSVTEPPITPTIYVPTLLPITAPAQTVQEDFTQFFTDYFAFLNAEQYKKSYAMLSPNFQKLQSYKEYVGFWSGVKKVELFSTELTSQSETVAFVHTETAYHYKNGDAIPAHTTYKLIKDVSKNIWFIEPFSGQ